MNRGFRIYLAARAISVFGSQAAPVGLAVAVLGTTASATALGLSLAARFGPQALLFLVGGVVGDRYPRAKVMIAANLLAGTGQAIFAAMLLTGDLAMPLLLLTQAVGGVSVALFNPAASGMLPLLVPPERIQRANGITGSVLNAAAVAGPAAAGVVVAALGTSWVIALDAASFFAGALLLSRLSGPGVRDGGAGAGRLPATRELALGARAFLSVPWVWISVLTAAVWHLVVNASFNVLGPQAAAEKWPWILAGVAAGTLAGSLLSIRWSPRRPLSVGGMLLALTTVVPFMLGLGVSSAWLLVPAAAAHGAVLGLFVVWWRSALQTRIPGRLLSRVVAWDQLGSFVCYPIGLVCAGPLAAAAGTGPVLVGGAVLVGVLQMAVAWAPAIRTIGTEPSGAPRRSPRETPQDADSTRTRSVPRSLRVT